MDRRVGALIFLLLGLLGSVVRAFRPQRATTWLARSPAGLRAPALAAVVADGISYLPQTGNPAIGNFFDNSTADLSFVQCYMHCLGTIKGVQYGIGYPVDTPVLLTRLSQDEQELMPVTPDNPVYDDLVNHVASQMDDNDIQIYKTPVVLTMQGDFEDEDEDEDEDEEEEEEEEEEDGEEGEEDELSLDDDEVDEEEEEEEDDDDDDEDDSAFWSSSPAGKLNATMAALPDITLVRTANSGSAEGGEINPESVVTEEDTKSMKAAHRKADRVTSEASDVSLIASFHFQKQNYHLVKLLDPIFVVGRRMEGVKGYYFSLLSNDETAKTTPALEKLIFESQNAQSKAAAPTGGASSSGSSREPGSSSSSSSNRLRSRRKWRKPAE